MRLLYVPLSLLLAGCDVVFGLSGTAATRDAGGDGPLDTAPDAPPDAPACPSIQTCMQSDDMHDEDGDCIADGCDLCPHLPGDDQDDDAIDMDRIGSGCDINLFAASAVFFDNFASQSNLAFRPGDSWSVQTDALQASPLDGIRYAIHPTPNGYPYQIRTQIELIGSIGEHGIAFNLDSPSTPLAGYVVTVRRTAPNENTVAVLKLEDGTSSLIATTPAVSGDVVDLQIFVGAALSVSTFNKDGMMTTSGNLQNDGLATLTGNTFDGVMSSRPNARVSYWHRTQ